MTEKYINPFTDFGFKKLFGEEANKDLLIDFLNQVLREKGNITELTYLRNEHLGNSQSDRKAVFDLYCQNERGEKFIVELQKAKQKFFKDRSLYYSTFAIQEQAQTGEWNFRLQAVYTIAIMDFTFDGGTTNPDKFMHDVALIERGSGQIFNDKLRYIYLEMPKFRLEEKDLKTRFDKWLFVIKNLSIMEQMPPKLQERIFKKLFQVAEIATYTPQEKQAYEASLKSYRDLKNSMDTVFEEAFEQGDHTRAVAVARRMKAKGYALSEIAEMTGLTEEEIVGL